MSTQSPITTHVLDTSLGRPAAGVAITLDRLRLPNTWEKVAEGITNSDGRLALSLAPATFSAGRYRLTFATGTYFQTQGIATFFPVVTIEFEVATPDSHYHVPLLLSPFGYSTYRGS